MSKLLLEVGSEYWFDAESIKQALNEYFGKEWNFTVTEAAQQIAKADECKNSVNGNHSWSETNIDVCIYCGEHRKPL